VAKRKGWSCLGGMKWGTRQAGRGKKKGGRNKRRLTGKRGSEAYFHISYCEVVSVSRDQKRIEVWEYGGREARREG